MIDPMQDVGRAIDLYIGELARRRKSPRTRADYERHLQSFADTLPPYTAVSEITVDECRRWLDRWRDAEPSTMASRVSILRGFVRFLIDEGHIAEPGPMAKIQRPRRKRYEDLDVVTIGRDDAARLLEACETWQETLCIATALYTGRRRAALNAARRRDVNLEGEAPTIRFRDKGDKIIVQRIPNELADLIRAADQEDIWPDPTAYLIPSRRPSTVTRKLRKDSLIWDTVKIVARRAGVETHVHALRAAFAVQFDDQHPDKLLTLKDLLGHARLESTQIYLRRRDKAKGMEAVADLSWGPVRVRTANAETAANSGQRPIRDSNPCSDQPEQQSLDSEGAPITGVPLLDESLAAKPKTRKGSRT
jgi:integrase